MDASNHGWERRLARLERENKLLRFGMMGLVAAVAGLALLPQARAGQVAERIEAKEFVVRDEAGKARIKLRINKKENQPNLDMLDTNDKLRDMLGVDSGDTSHLDLRDKDGKIMQRAFVTADGKAVLYLGNRGEGLHDAIVTAEPEGNTSLHIGAPEKGKYDFTVFRRATGTSVGLVNAAGEKVFEAPAKK